MFMIDFIKVQKEILGHVETMNPTGIKENPVAFSHEFFNIVKQSCSISNHTVLVKNIPISNNTTFSLSH